MLRILIASGGSITQWIAVSLACVIRKSLLRLGSLLLRGLLLLRNLLLLCLSHLLQLLEQLLGRASSTRCRRAGLLRCWLRLRGLLHVWFGGIFGRGLGCRWVRCRMLQGSGASG